VRLKNIFFKLKRIFVKSVYFGYFILFGSLKVLFIFYQTITFFFKRIF
jgi:hypothetical protein